MMHRSTHSKSTDGLMGSLLASPGHSLSEVFAELRNSQSVSSIIENPAEDQFAARINIEGSGGEGYWGLLQLTKGLRIITRDWVYESERHETCPGEGWFEFQLIQIGHLTIETEQNETIEINGPSLFIAYQPVGGDIYERALAGTPERSITIYCRENYIQSKILAGNSSLPSSITQLITSKQQEMNRYIVPLSSRLMEQAASFFRFEYLDELELVYAEAKARETLCLIFHELSHIKEATLSKYNDTDLKRFKGAYDFLDEHFNPPPTITQLSRMIGINETKLKSGFKDLYGVTVFEFAHQKRMQYAMTLLQDQRLPVGLVSEMSGYQHQATFATAFKNYFGIRPKDVKKISTSPPPEID